MRKLTLAAFWVGVFYRNEQSRENGRNKEETEMGCLLAMFAGFFPRFGLFLVWILRPVRVDLAFNTFILPLLGIIFLPFATLMYVLLYRPGVGIRGWDLFWVLFSAVLDIGHWGASYTQRGSLPGYQSRTA